MKEIVLKIDDDAYRRVEDIANARKISLNALVEELVESASNGAQHTADDVNKLFSALDKGRNTEPIGRLGRQKLHDRPVLHRY
jgi:predicted transcriptional regulator